MGIIGFTVFKSKILNGEKTQTIRLKKKRMLEVPKRTWGEKR